MINPAQTAPIHLSINSLFSNAAIVQLSAEKSDFNALSGCFNSTLKSSTPVISTWALPYPPPPQSKEASERFNLFTDSSKRPHQLPCCAISLHTRTVRTEAADARHRHSVCHRTQWGYVENAPEKRVISIYRAVSVTSRGCWCGLLAAN